MAASGRVVSVNVARAREIEIAGRAARTAIGKRASAERGRVRPSGLEGDEQADPSVHGGPAKAVYVYPSEHYRFWQTVRAQAGVAGWGDRLEAGALGENLTIAGVVETDVFVGDVLRIPDCALAVAQPRLPCFKLNAAMGFTHAAKLMVESGWCGWYLAVREPGTIGAGDAFDVVAGPREVSVWELFRARTGKGD